MFWFIALTGRIKRFRGLHPALGLCIADRCCSPRILIWVWCKRISFSKCYWDLRLIAFSCAPLYRFWHCTKCAPPPYFDSSFGLSLSLSTGYILNTAWVYETLGTNPDELTAMRVTRFPNRFFPGRCPAFAVTKLFSVHCSRSCRPWSDVQSDHKNI